MTFENFDFIFHIGWPKTGTSAIQHFLFANREKLAKLYKILYPKTGKMHFEHHYFVIALTSKQNINRIVYNFNKGYKEIFNELMDEINCVGKDSIKKILISSEFMCAPSFVKELYEIKKKIDEVKINVTKLIAYVRRQDLLLESHYRQFMKEKWFFSHFNAFAKVNIKNGLLNFWNILNSWATIVDKSNLLIRIYERKLFPEKNIVLDFLKLLEIDIPEAKNFKTDINLSLSHISALALRKLKLKYYINEDENPKLLKFIYDMDKKEGSILKTFMSLEERLELLNKFKECNELLSKEYFNSSKNLFDISKEEIEFYKQQEKIEEYKIEEAIANRFKQLEKYFLEIANNPLKREFVYFIENFDGKNISGWIIDFVNPPAKLVLKLNNIPIYEFEANQPRQDVLDSFPDIGYSNCGFKVSLLNIDFPKVILENDKKVKLSLLHKRSNKELLNIEIDLDNLRKLLKRKRRKNDEKR